VLFLKVFAHYMLITRPPNGDYTEDMTLAQAMGVDAFAVNFGGWGVVWEQQKEYLADFYSQAETFGFKLFLSIDTTSVNNASMVRTTVQYEKFNRTPTISISSDVLVTLALAVCLRSFR
jgi:hypothetical protein